MQMQSLQPTLISPADVPGEDLAFRDPPELTFEGFSQKAFDALTKLREAPHIGTYREIKPVLTKEIKQPFKRYRDDLVVNWVLPSRLDLETEKNVFSRFLKNDFGAGGCHDNRWMSFYRPGLKRLTDVQLSHSLTPDGLKIGAYVGAYAREPLERVKHSISAAPGRFLDVVNSLLRSPNWYFEAYRGRGEQRESTQATGPLAKVPELTYRASGLWVRTVLSPDEVVRLEGRVLSRVLRIIEEVWPMYRFFLRPPSHIDD